MRSDIQPGLLVLQGNRTELLADALFDWTRAHPLGALEEEVFIVQNHGIAEWLKMQLAARQGICAALRVELPARFLWRAYRQVLGRASVPAQSPLDKTPLAWRLMRQLPGLLGDPAFAPLARFLRAGASDVERRLQLCRRLADLYDQYQLYRSDWLDAWAAGRDVLTQPGAEAQPLPADQRWQAALWRELYDALDERERAAVRPVVQQRFLAALASDAGPAAPLPRRIVLFGTSHLPMQTLQALAALAGRCQVLMAVPNPCRYHWADIIQGRELLRIERRRHPLRHGRPLADVPLQDMHLHAHPLLAAWGAQGRDFVRQLDAFDDALAAQQRFAAAKVDLFDEGDGETLLQQVQARIRELVPLAEHPPVEARADDRSIVFHVGHGALREVEILHDQLLRLLADPPGGRPLAPRDIIVMVPAIDGFAPAVEAVFGQYGAADPRHIPYAIADLKERERDPLLLAVEWLLRLPQQRCTFSEVRSLLDVPAVAARFGLDAAELPRLTQWMDAAGIRWGLSGGQRAELGLDACGEQNTWLFGLRRMLLGYASGSGSAAAGPAAYGGIEPCSEVGGLEASIAGSLAVLLERLVAWWGEASTPATPARWATRCRRLVDDFMAPVDEAERLTVLALHESLGRWLEACESAGFEDEAVPLAVAREAWLGEIDEPQLARRFRAGGVTFCSLLPMRSIPFEVVCLLGMNDGDYPRPAARSDFDLLALPGRSRPGDRSRRSDDRQLMLDALLAARRVLHVSWSGRSARDNSEQPPSVLVSQLRDYLAAGWRGEGVLAARTTEHPLQPFSRRYFEGAGSAAGNGAAPAGGALFTHAREWRAAHVRRDANSAAPPRRPRFEPDPDVPVTIEQLTGFLKNPVRSYFRQRLRVVFPDRARRHDDDEAFDLDGLDRYGLLDAVLKDIDAVRGGSFPCADELHRMVGERVRRIQRTGRLPFAAFGIRQADELVGTLLPMLAQWQRAHARYPAAAERQPLRFEHGGVTLGDWLDGLHAGDDGQAWLQLHAGRFFSKAKQPELKPDKLLGAWVRALVAAACGAPAGGVIVGSDATVSVACPPADLAADALRSLLDAWRDGMDAPLPVACRTAFARLDEKRDVRQVYEGGYRSRGEVEEPCLARVHPDYESLTACGRFEELATRLYRPISDWIDAQQVRAEPHAGSAAGMPAAAATPAATATA